MNEEWGSIIRLGMVLAFGAYVMHLLVNM